MSNSATPPTSVMNARCIVSSMGYPQPKGTNQALEH
jgi:hypothetical protein